MMKERERDILVRKVNGQQIEAGACLPITVTLISAKLPHRLEMSFGTSPPTASREGCATVGYSRAR